MHTAAQNTKNSAANAPSGQAAPLKAPCLMTDLLRFLAFAACLTVAALFLQAELAPLGTGVASGLLDPHNLAHDLARTLRKF